MRLNTKYNNHRASLLSVFRVRSTLSVLKRNVANRAQTKGGTVWLRSGRSTMEQIFAL